MKRLLILLIVLACASIPALAEEKPDTILSTVKGRGQNRDEAIKKALYQAVSQTRGVRIDSGDYSLGFQTASAGVDTQDSKRTIDFDAVSVQTGGTVFTTQIEGLVKTYEVIDEKKLDDGTYEVTLKCWVYDHLPVDLTTRRRLAIMPIKTLAASYSFGPLTIPAEQLSRMLTQKLSAALTQTNKFAVLDREYIAEYLREKKILAFDSTSLEEQARIGEVLGADYMFVGTVSDARLQIKDRSTSAIVHTLREYEADFRFDYRLIVAPSRQVRLSDSVTIEMETDEIKKLVADWEPSDLDYTELADNLITLVANKTAETIIDRIYPARIAAVSADGKIIINQGGTRIAIGSILNVYTPGTNITDPDTNESLGTAEILIATVKIEQVAPNISYATVVSGDPVKITKGLVCRPKPLAQPTQTGFKSRIQRTPQGGVKMPFD